MHLFDYVLVRIYQCYTPFGLFIGQNYLLYYTFWTIYWSGLVITVLLTDYKLVKINHHYTPFGFILVKINIYSTYYISHSHNIIQM